MGVLHTTALSACAERSGFPLDYHNIPFIRHFVASFFKDYLRLLRTLAMALPFFSNDFLLGFTLKRIVRKWGVVLRKPTRSLHTVMHFGCESLLLRNSSFYH